MPEDDDIDALEFDRNTVTLIYLLVLLVCCLLVFFGYVGLRAYAS